MHTIAQHGIHLSRRLPSAEHPSNRSDARLQCWAHGARSLPLPLHPTVRRCLGPRCQRARRICLPGRLQPLPAAPGTPGAGSQLRRHTGPGRAAGVKKSCAERSAARSPAHGPVGAGKCAALQPAQQGCRSAEPRTCLRPRGHAQGSGGREKKQDRVSGLRRAHASCFESLSLYTSPVREGWQNRKHAVEEGVDGVEQAPEDVSDGASAHDRAPLHHAAVLYERHLRRFVQQAVHSREPDNLQLQLAH